MRRGIRGGDGSVPPFSDDPAFKDDDGADRDFALSLSTARQLECAAHETFVVYSHSIVAGGFEETS